MATVGVKAFNCCQLVQPTLPQLTFCHLDAALLRTDLLTVSCA